MSDSYFQLNEPEGGGDKVDAEQVTVGAEVVKRERDQLAGRTAEAIAEVLSTGPTGGAWGLVIRSAGPVNVNALRSSLVRQTTILTDTTETTCLDAGASGIYHDIDDIIVSNTSTADVRVDFRDASGATGNQAFAIMARAGDTRGLAASVPIPQTNHGTAWTVQISISTTDVRVHVIAHKTS